jgi:hypothetical protein
MKIKLLITFFLVLIGGISYFSYPIIKNRYFQSFANNDATNQKKSPTVADENNNLSSDNDNPSDDSDSENTPDESTVPDNVFLDIDTEDCDSSCDQFEDTDEKKYCLEYCGIQENETSASTNNDCEKLTDLEKDYCYKNQAIAKKNITLCKKINDKKLLESCKNRLTEDVLDNGTNDPIE